MIGRLWLWLGLGSLAVMLATADNGHAQKGKPKKPPVVPGNTILQSKEAEALRNAYILLAGANHNYAGNRARAMKSVEQAVRSLDRQILKRGTNGEKVVARQEDIVAARAKFIAKHSATVTQPQAISDLQLRQAAVILGNVRPYLVQARQANILRHVDSALLSINKALIVN